jgi:transcriptional regulator with XRE-family HTH domain
MTQAKDISLLKKIATVLKECRLASGLTQNDVYNDTGIHIGRIESYKINLTVSTLQILCDYYDLSILDFFKKVDAL